MTSLRKVPIHRALTRPQLLAGGEREPILILGLLAFTLVFVGLSWTTSLMALVLSILGGFVLRKLAKVDPLMSRIYLRHIHVRPFLPAQSSLWSEARAFSDWSVT